MDAKIEDALESLDDCVAYAKAVASIPLRDKEWRKALATIRATLEKAAIAKLEEK